MPNLVQQVFHPGMFHNNPPKSGSNSEESTTSQNETNPECTVTVTTKTTPVLPISSTPKPPVWQKQPSVHANKRKRVESTSPKASTGLNLTNNFSELPLDIPPDTLPAKVNKPTKPPPIILYGIQDVNQLSKLMESTIDKTKFNFRIINKNQLRILINCTDEYKKAMNLMRCNGLIGHTFTRKEDKCYRIVIKNLHHTTPHEAIVEEIEKSGNKVRGEIINSKFGPEKVPTSTFFINLEPHANNPKVKDIKYIFHQAIKIEDPRKSKTVVQCQRCQQYGHCKNNCMRPYRCVKCGEDHKTSDCSKKDNKTPAKCALCFGDHPANYKGCQVYQEIYKRKFGNRSKKSTLPGTSTRKPTHLPSNNISYKEKPTDFPPLPSKPVIHEECRESEQKKTHWNTQKPNIPIEQKLPTQSLEAILLKQSERFDILLQQMSSLMSLVTTLLSKLQK